MIKKRKVPVGVGTPTGTMFESKNGEYFTSDIQYNTATGVVSRFLLHGSEKATATNTLLSLTGMKTARDLQKAIEKERSCGIPILTKPGFHGGYFLPDEDPFIAAQECRAFIHYMRAKGLGCLHSLKPARKLLHWLEVYLSGQEEIQEYRDDEAEAEEEIWERETFTG